MNNTLRLALLAGVVVASGSGVRVGAEPAVSQPLPLKDVVLFSSGVGYFQRAGKVNGAATLDLSFRPEQINDVLKSLVLLDSTGTVRPVTYAGKDPRLPGRSGQSIESGTTLGTLLRRFQGARVRVELLAGRNEPVEGRIVSISFKNVPAGGAAGGIVQQEVLNLLGEGGLRSISLENIAQIKLLDERLDRELRESLEAQAVGQDDQRRKVTLAFSGDGEREVRAGYLQEMPDWKTTYRLVLEKGKKPYLQGWAIVENTTDEDWKEVNLSLVSGRPISFLQDLYQPLYVPRPVVQAQVIGSPLPQTYGDAVELGDKDRQANADFAEERRKSGMAGRAAAAPPAPAGPRGAIGPQGRAGGMGGSGGAFGRDLNRADSAFGVRNGAMMSQEMLSRSVASQADGTERGALFEYAIRTPLTLKQGQSAMVPIVAGPIDGEGVSIFDPQSDATRALNGFKLKNNTGMHLSGGPVTVYRDGIYAGDAQIGNTQPGDDRLLSYAVDLDLVIARETPKFRQDTLSISAKSGVLLISRKQQRETLYTFRNKSAEPKSVLVQHAIEPEFKLVTPEKPSEKTPEEYRFVVPVPAGKTAELKVLTERPLMESIALLDVDLNLLTQWSLNSQVSEKLRGALKLLVGHRRKITDLQAQRAAVEAELKAIDQEQARIRQNMAQLDKNSPLYMQYVKKLTEQETRIEALRTQSAKLAEAERDARKELQQAVDGLTSD